MLMEKLQQKVDVITPHMTVVHCDGEVQEIDGVGDTELEMRTQKLEDIKWSELDYFKRFMHMGFLAKGLIMSEDDLARKGAFAIKITHLMTQLENAAQRAITKMALGVVYDKEKKIWTVPTPGAGMAGGQDRKPYSSNDTYIGGIMGTNYVGDKGITPETLPMQVTLKDGSLASSYTDYDDATNIDMALTNVIPVNYARSGDLVDSGLTIEKVRAVREALEARNAVEGDDYFSMAITPKQKSDLILQDKLQNSLYGFQSLPGGMVSELLGIRFIVTNYVPKVNIGGDKYVYACPVWKPSSVAFGIWRDVKLESERLTQLKWDAIGVKCQCGFGAARRRLEDVLTVQCA